MSKATTARVLLIVLSVLGLIISGYLAYVYIGRLHLPCTKGWLSGCTEVQQSRYAQIAGVPIPVYGVAFYLFVIIDQLFLLRWHENRTWHWLFGLGLFFGFAFSAYLTVLEAFVIKAWCVWCVGSGVLATALFVVWLILGRYQSAAPKTPATSGTERAG